MHNIFLFLSVEMPEKTTVPYLIKILAVIIGGIIALVLSGDIDQDGKIKINFGVILKFTSSVMIGLYIGEFCIDWYDWEHLSYFSQGAVMMMFSVFGMLVMGIIYQAIQVSFKNKSLIDVVIEIKRALGALLK